MESKKKNLENAVFSRVLGGDSSGVVAPQTAAHHAEDQEQHDDPKETTAAIAEDAIATIFVRHGRNIGKGHVIHKFHLVLIYLSSTRSAPGKESLVKETLHLLCHLFGLL